MKIQAGVRFFLLYGEEFYLIHGYENQLIREWSKTDEAGMNRLVLVGKEADATAIADFGNLAPFMAENRLIIIEDSGFFDSAGEKKELTEVLNNLPETTYIIFSERKINKKTAFFKAFSKRKEAQSLECNKKSDKELVEWINAYVGRAGKKITRSAANLLIERIGSDMMLLSQELDKLIGYIGKTEGIRECDVEAIAGGVVVSKVFEMVDAVSRGEKERALSLYRDLLYNRENPMGILTLLGRQYDRVLHLKRLDGSGMSAAELAEKIGAPAWKIGFFRQVASRYNLKNLEKLLVYRVELEETIKTTGLNPQLASELFLIQALTNA